MPRLIPVLVLTALTTLGGACQADKDSAPPDTNVPQTTDTDTYTDTDSGLAPPEGDPAAVELSGPCPMDSDLGGFVVEAYEEYSIVDGSISNGIVPITVLQVMGTYGDCQVLRRNNPYCDPLCESGFTCDFDGSCIPYPEEQDLGIVSIAGLLQDVIMEPLEPGYSYFDTTLPNPAFLPGALLEFRMPDGVYGPVVLHGVGVDPLVAVEETWTLVEGQDLSIYWEPPTAKVQRSSIDLSVNIDQHGNTPATVVCTFDDDGEGILSGEAIAQMYSLGVSGFPSGSLSRRTADSALIDGGCMDFSVGAPRTVAVDVDGFTPCFDDSDCPDGQTCNQKLQICE